MRSVPISAFLMLSSLAAHAGPGASNPYNGRRVLVVGIDGLHAGALKQQVETGHAPNIAGLVANGTVTWTAHAGGTLGGSTQQPTISGPGWTSIMTGMWTDRHHVVGNDSPAYNQPGTTGSYLVDQAPHFGLRLDQAKPGTFVSSITSWNWIEDYLIAGQPTVVDYHTKGIGSSYALRDSDVTAKAVAHLGSADPDVLFLHFDQCDGAGHSYGFSPTVPNYMNAIEAVDGLIGNVLSAINARAGHTSENWLVILTSDHGGTTGGGHGGQSVEERTIPFIVSGGGVPVAVSTASPGQAAVPATLMRYLGVSIPSAWNLAEDGFVTGPKFAAAQSGATVQLSWAMPTNGITGLTGYELRRNGAVIGTFPTAQTNATDAAPTGGTNLYELVLLGTAEAPLRQSLLVAGEGAVVWDDANANNKWNTTDPNWSGGDTFATGDQVYFSGSTGEVVDVDAAGVTPFSTTVSGNGSYTFSGGSILNGTLAKTGSGALTLGASNAFTAVTTSSGPESQSAGSINVGNAGALGTGTVTFGNSGSMTGLYFLPAMGSATVANNLVLSSPPSAVTTRFLTDETNVTLTLSGLISGGNSNQEFLVDNDSGSSDVGKIRLTSAANTLTVSRFRLNRGGMVVTSDGALGNTANGLALDVSGNLAGSGLVLEGEITLAATRALNILSQTVIDTQATDDIVNGPITYSAQLVKRGSAALRLNAAGTGTAGISLLEGSLSLGNATAMGTGALNVATTASAGFLNATNLPAIATVTNPVVLPADTAATNRTVLMTGGSGKQLELSGIISGGSANTTLYLNTNLSGDTAATFLLSGANTFTGKTQLNRGSLSINSNASFGAATNALVIDANAGSKLSFGTPMSFTHPTTLSTVTAFDTAANLVDVTAAIDGGAALTKSGTGTLVLSAVNPLTGAVTVSEGQLRVNGSLAASTNTVTAAANATLGGVGTINRPVVSNGKLAPGGDAVGSLTLTDLLTIAGGSSLAFDLTDWTGAAGTGYDTIPAAGVTITATSASKFTVNLKATGLTHFSETAKSFVLTSGTVAPNGLAADNWTVSVTGFSGTGSWAVAASGNNLVLTYTPLGTAFTAWASANLGPNQDKTFNGDPDRDGLRNGIEFVLGTAPGVDSSASAPSLQTTADSFVFTFTRVNAATYLNPVVEISETMAAGSWTTVATGIVVTPKNASSETVTVTIPKASRAHLFARLKVDE